MDGSFNQASESHQLIQEELESTKHERAPQGCMPGGGFAMSMEAQLPTHYNGGTSGSSHSNLDPMEVIMQELQLIKKDVNKMRGNITNLSIEQRDQNNIGVHVISHTQWEYGNLSLYARSFEHNSYVCYERNRFGAWEQKVESLFYSYSIREEERFQVVLKSLSYEVDVWWDCKYENRRRMGSQPIKTFNEASIEE
ncbi:hypothetical protein M9H77_21251 [Catharanthus roseus]|uniref:Uncharacterized protein n=1 Tax=Catharanthus roseus TaxID=4058 RepID=A0ACC0AR46_CATRO|nr:hypothetical protein M9H77_21251 [Catharanthus roseus]